MVGCSMVAEWLSGRTYARYNLVPLVGGNTGVQMAGWFNKEINPLDDLKGVKMQNSRPGGRSL